MTRVVTGGRFRAQTLRPDLIEAELALIGGTMVKEGALTRRNKEYIFLVCSAANLSTYCVTAHCEIVRMLGIHGPEPERVALDHNRTNIRRRTSTRTTSSRCASTRSTTRTSSR